MGSPRLSRLESSALATFATVVRARFGERVRSLRLFGSRARGEGHEDSDLDVHVLLDGMTREERRALQDAAYDVSEEFHVIVSPLVASADAWRLDAPIARAIATDGVPL
jgi:hypothetical protein